MTLRAARWPSQTVLHPVPGAAAPSVSASGRLWPLRSSVANPGGGLRTPFHLAQTRPLGQEVDRRKSPVSSVDIQGLRSDCFKSLRKNKSVFTCHDPVSINIRTVGRYPQKTPQERPVVSSRTGSGPAATLRAGLKSEPERANHMLAML